MWVEKLKKYNSQFPVRKPAAENEKLIFCSCKYWKKKERQKSRKILLSKKFPNSTSKQVFIQQRAALENPLYFKVRQEARTRFLHNKSAQMLDKDDLEKLWHLLKANCSLPEDGTDRINYDQFCHVSQELAKELGPKFKPFFQPSVFLKCDRDEYGRIEIVPFFHYVVRKVNLFQTRIQISLYDSVGMGYLKEKDLENYIFELIPTFPQLSSLQENFCPYYVITAVRKFFFFLDPKRTGKIAIKDMLTSPILAELYELRSERWSFEEAMQNWFSVQSTLRVYEMYLRLDTDHNGMLKKSELAKYAPGLTNIFIDRVFEEFQTFGGEMDYKTFLDFVLAMENKKTQQSLAYFFRVLDVYHKNALDTFVINLFFRQIIQKLEAREKFGFRVEDVKDEIWDMAKPKVPMAITLEDLVNCGQGDTIVSMLTDAKAFYDYDQRETGGDTDDFDVPDDHF